MRIQKIMIVGSGLMGSGIAQVCAQYLSDETGVFIDFYQNFDRILLSETSAWFGGETRASLYKRNDCRSNIAGGPSNRRFSK